MEKVRLETQIFFNFFIVVCDCDSVTGFFILHIL